MRIGLKTAAALLFLSAAYRRTNLAELDADGEVREVHQSYEFAMGKRLEARDEGN